MEDGQTFEKMQLVSSLDLRLWIGAWSSCTH